MMIHRKYFATPVTAISESIIQTNLSPQLLDNHVVAQDPGPSERGSSQRLAAWETRKEFAAT
jgi:hypothetical protein